MVDVDVVCVCVMCMMWMMMCVLARLMTVTLVYPACVIVGAWCVPDWFVHASSGGMCVDAVSISDCARVCDAIVRDDVMCAIQMVPLL